MSDVQLTIPVWLKPEGQFFTAHFEQVPGAHGEPVDAPLPDDERRTVALYRKTLTCITALERRKPKFPRLPVHVWTWVDPEWGPVASLRLSSGIRLKRNIVYLLPDMDFLVFTRNAAAARMWQLGITNEWRDPLKANRTPQDAKPERISVRTVSGGLPTLGRRRR